MPATDSKKTHVYHCVTTHFLKIRLFNHLGTEDANFCSFSFGISAHSCVIQDLTQQSVLIVV